MKQKHFIAYIFGEYSNRRYFITALIAALLQFSIFKSLYPFADFFSDSYSYIYGASAHLNINIWPIGYSKFLQAVHELTHSDTALVCLQYFLLELSCLYLFFSLCYFYTLGKMTRAIIFLFLFANPMSLYICNYVNSDPLFAALSVFWITELIWIINRPAIYHIFTHSLLLFCCFTVRNNAYYYPIISIIAFLLSRQSLYTKLTGIVLPLLFIGAFIIMTRNAAMEMTGTKQFSLFTGWQLANNALYIRQYIQVDTTKFPSKETRELDRMSQNFYNQVPTGFDAYLSDYVGNFFIRDFRAPLKQYFYRHYHPLNEYQEVETWGKAAVPFAAYGSWLIKKYPISYARHFMLRNVKNYIIPPLEKMEIYNLGEDKVWLGAVKWFDYKNSNVTSISKTAQGSILFSLPYLFCFLNILFTCTLIWLLISRKTIVMESKIRSLIIIGTSFLLANLFFSIFATIIVMRYQFFPMMITLILPLLMIEQLENKVNSSSIHKLQLGTLQI